MQLSLKQLGIWAMLASVGLILLQAYWVMHEWRTAKDIVQRQVNVALQEAVVAEASARKDSLRNYLVRLLSDSQVVQFSSLYNQQMKNWTIRMADTKNPRDFTNFTLQKISIDSVLTATQRQQIIQHLAASAIDEPVDRNTIMYYTQRFGNLWTERFDSLGLNQSLLYRLFRQNLSIAGIQQDYDLLFIDTMGGVRPPEARARHISSTAYPVQYKALWDYEHRHLVQAVVKNPFSVLLSRMWLALSCTVLLVSLAIWCLIRMYQVIRNQKQLSEIRNDFIDNMTHELKTPLATIQAAIDSLQYFNGLQSEERTSRYLNASRNELNRLNDVVSRIMQTALYEKQPFALQKEKIALRPLIEEIAASLKVLHNRAFSITVEADMPEPHVFADRLHFSNAITNLLENAIRYVPDNLHIRAVAHSKKEGITIAISDNGPGIHPAHQPFLFDKFYRVPARNVHDVKGFGLGLYYVKQIIMRHGGTVLVNSSAGNGTTFIIKMPHTKS